MGSRSKHNSEMSHACFCMGNTIGHQRNLLQPLLGAATGVAAGLAKVPRGEGGEGERDGDYKGAGVGHCALKNWGSHIDASHSRQPLVKGERLVRYEVNAVIGEPMGLRRLSTKRF